MDAFRISVFMTLCYKCDRYYHKMRQLFCYKLGPFYYKMRVITTCDDFITKCDVYYNMRWCIVSKNGIQLFYSRNTVLEISITHLTPIARSFLMFSGANGLSCHCFFMQEVAAGAKELDRRGQKFR